MLKRRAVLAIAYIALGTAIRAQRVSIDASLRTSDRSYVEATGEASVTAKPDQAVVEVGVVTDEPTAAAAAAQNARQSEALFVEVRKLIAAGDQVKSAGYSVAPHFKYPKPGAAASIASYTATNVVEVTVNDLTRVGKIIDAALAAGANTIRSIDFRLKDPRHPLAGTERSLSQRQSRRRGNCGRFGSAHRSGSVGRGSESRE